MKNQAVPDLATLDPIELRIPVEVIVERTNAWRAELEPMLTPDGRATNAFCVRQTQLEAALLAEYGIEGGERGWFTSQHEDGRIAGRWGENPEDAVIALIYYWGPVRWIIRDNGTNSLIAYIGTTSREPVDQPIDLLPASIDAGGLW